MILSGSLLLKDLCEGNFVPFYDANLIRTVAKEMGEHFTRLHHYNSLIEGDSSGGQGYLPAFTFYTLAFWRNRKLVLAYLRYRLDKIVSYWWHCEQPGEANPKVQERLSNYEKTYLRKFEDIVSDYCDEIGWDLTTGFVPPKHPLIPVRILKPIEKSPHLKPGNEYLVRPEEVERQIYSGLVTHLSKKLV